MRAAFIALFVAALVACGKSNEPTDQRRTLYRVGFLAYGTPASDANPQASDFQQGLRDIGYVEGRDIVVEYRYGNLDQLPGLAEGLVRAPVDVIVAVGDAAAAAARKATSTVPIVLTEYAGDPVRDGLASSLGHPGGNVTGLATRSDELWDLRLGRLRDLVPRIKRIAVLWNPANPANRSCFAAITKATQSMGMQPRGLEVSDAATLDIALAALEKERPDALVPCSDGSTHRSARKIAESAVKLRVPTVAAVRDYVDEGLLLSVGADVSAQRRQAAYYVDKMRKGNKPSDMPIEQAAAFDTVVNVGTARRIGVVVPPSFMFEDKVE